MKRFALALALFAAPAFAKTVTGEASFQAKATPGFMSINGTGAKVACKVDVKDGKASGECQTDLTGLTTGIELRDSHMKEKYLETAKYPSAKLTLKDWPVTEADSPFEGQLTIKDETKPVKGVAHVAGGKLHAAFQVTFADYPHIGAPEFKGIAVGKTADVTVDGAVVD
jgi:polyisoprenoid-binding protein YceI